MQNWSDSVIHADFRVRVFLDTNLLVYLTDKRYPSLNDFIEIVNVSYPSFVELVSSNYVIFEFVGVRKRQHYHRLVIKNLANTPQGIDTLIDSVQKFRDRDNYYLAKEEFNDVKFENVIPIVKNLVDAEVQKLSSTELNIKYEYGTFHVDQFKPAFEICLTSKLSNHDSLVLVSSVFPQADAGPYHVLFLTADADLNRFCDPKQVDVALSGKSVLGPSVYHVSRIEIPDAGTTNLKVSNTKADLQEKIKVIIIELMKRRLSEYYLGKTIRAKDRLGTIPEDFVFIKLVKNYPLVKQIERLEAALPHKKLYVTVVSKDLDFVYTTRKDIEAFWHNKKPITPGYALLPTNKKDVIVSFSARDIDEDDNERPVEGVILDSIKGNDNLVFLHPDSFL
jgi:predicted nucleic acid-binding protein